MGTVGEVEGGRSPLCLWGVEAAGSGVGRLELLTPGLSSPQEVYT